MPVKRVLNGTTTRIPKIFGIKHKTFSPDDVCGYIAWLDRDVLSRYER
jgi:hypothetical protein